MLIFVAISSMRVVY